MRLFKNLGLRMMLNIGFDSAKHNLGVFFPPHIFVVVCARTQHKEHKTKEMYNVSKFQNLRKKTVRPNQSAGSVVLFFSAKLPFSGAHPCMYIMIDVHVGGC